MFKVTKKTTGVGIMYKEENVNKNVMKVVKLIRILE